MSSKVLAIIKDKYNNFEQTILADGTLAEIIAAITSKSAGATASASVTRPANTTAYTAGDVISTEAGANMEFTGLPEDAFLAVLGARYQMDVGDLPTEAGAIRLHLFSAAPTAIADGAAFSVIAADRAKYLGYIEFGTAEELGDTCFAQADDKNWTGKLAGTTLYGQAQTMTALEPTAGLGFEFTLNCAEV